ncbi:MAG: hypothetical protein ACRDOK_23340 [Streptosporangiaceae bacterium]
MSAHLASSPKVTKVISTSRPDQPDRQRPGQRAPGPNTGYRTIEKTTFEVTCDADYDQVARDAVSDGCWPLITSDPGMPAAEVLAACHYQPNLERHRTCSKACRTPRRSGSRPSRGSRPSSCGTSSRC